MRIALFGVVAALGLGACVSTSEYEKTKSTLQATTAERDNLKAQLAATQQEAAAAKQNAQATQATLDSVAGMLSTTRTQLDQANAKLAAQPSVGSVAPVKASGPAGSDKKTPKGGSVNRR